MITTDSPIEKEIVHNCRPLFDVSAQTAQEESSTFAYLQNEELSSKEMSSPQTKETSLLQLRYSDPGDVLAQIGFVPKVIEIPDEVWQKLIEDFSSKGHLDNPGKMGRNGTVFD